MPAVRQAEVVPPAPAEPSTEAVAAVAQWSSPGPQGRGCSFCPRESSALLVHSVPLLPDRIGSVLGIRLPYTEQRYASAICADCIRVIDDAERTTMLRQAMRSHFEANQDTSFSENLRRGGRRTQRLPSSAMAMTRSGAVATSFYSATVKTAAADDQQSQASSCDGCGSSSTSGGGGGGGSGGHSCVGASSEQLDSTQQAALASQRVIVPKVARKRYFCSQCEKSFTAKSHYDDHVNKHSAAKKFVCMLCGKAFKFKRGLREHARDAHARPVHSGGSSAEPLYAMLDGEDVLAYAASDRLAAGGGCEAASHSGIGVEPKLVASIKVEAAGGGGGGGGGDEYYDDECDDFDDECDALAPARPVSSALGRGSTSRSSSSSVHQESVSRLPPPIPASHVVAGERQQECLPSSSASAIVFKRRGDRGCTSSERETTAVAARPPARLDNGYCGEEEDDDEGEDDDDNIQVCSSSESGSENTAGHARRQRRPLPLPEGWQMLGRELSAPVPPPFTVSHILASALLPSTSTQQQQQQQRQRRKRLSPQHQQKLLPDAVQLMVLDGEAGGEALPPATGDGAVTFPCTLCQSRFKYKRGLVSHVKRKHRDPVEDPDERQRAVEFLQLLKDQRHGALRKRTGSFGACSTNGSLASASRTGVASLEETAFAAVGDSVGSVGASDCGDDDDCDGRSASGTFYQQSSASGVLLTAVDSAGSAGASDCGDDTNGNDENDLFDGRGAATSTEATPARIASAATAVAVAGSRDVRGRGNGGRGSPTQPRWVAELRQNAPKFRPLVAATGRQPITGSRDNCTEARCPTPGDRPSGDVEYKGAQGAAVSSTAAAVKSVSDGDPVLPQPGGKRRRLGEDQSTVRA